MLRLTMEVIQPQKLVQSCTGLKNHSNIPNLSHVSNSTELRFTRQTGSQYCIKMDVTDIYDSEPVPK